MTKFDLFDSIGNANDKAVENAKQPIKSHKKIIVAIGSIAACAVFACAGVLIYQNMNNGNGTSLNSGITSAVDTSTVSTIQENSGETALEQMSFEVYYVANGKTEHKTIVTGASPKNLFAKWKEENQIGEEVHFISAKTSDNGTTEISEYSGVEVATHKAGDHIVFTLTVTKNLEQYYDTIGKELLLETLEKTMTGICDPKPDEYKLVLSYDTENEKSESNRIDSNDIQYNDQGEILE